MHRVGVAPDRAAALAKLIVSQSELELEGVYTHFAVADEPELDNFTAGQLAGLRRVLDGLAAAGRDLDDLVMLRVPARPPAATSAPCSAA